MLPAGNRLTGSREFATTVRDGRRTARRRLVLHLVVPGEASELGTTSDGPPVTSEAPRVGFVVSRAVGNAVVRTRVKRQLRHLVRDRLAALPRGSVAVIRALPAAAGATSRALGADLDAALEVALRRSPRGAAPAGAPR